MKDIEHDYFGTNFAALTSLLLVALVVIYMVVTGVRAVQEHAPADSSDQLRFINQAPLR